MREAAARSNVMTRDHVKPVCDGGTITVACCRQCNREKGGLYLDEWAAALDAKGDHRAAHVRAVAALYPDLAGRPPYPCCVCGRKFARKYDAVQHARALGHFVTPLECQEAIVPLGA